MQKRGIVVEVIDVDYVEVPNDPTEEQPPAQKRHRSIAVPVLAAALVVVLGIYDTPFFRPHTP